MKEGLKKFLKDASNQKLIDDCNWETLYDKLNFFININGYEVEDAWELTSVMHDSGIVVLNDPNLTSIPNHMFYGCKDTHFQTIEIPDHIIGIGVEAFSMSESIKKIILPKGLREINIYAFSYCDIEEIHYPGTKDEFLENVTINDTIFEGSEGLKLCFSDITIDANDILNF